mmetsp:Transcript_28111/g.39531  ORF Transcript_28111/g.39531 Transcript_28111/m.39531 type:complete len:294 (-) Transcript_28111:44-925(-)
MTVSRIFVIATAITLGVCESFSVSPKVGERRCAAVGMSPLFSSQNPLEDFAGERRDFLSRLAFSSSLLILPTSAAVASDDGNDYTSNFYNPDGSLKDDVQKEAKQRTIATTWDVSEERIVNFDGKDPTEGKPVRVSYQLPEKWGTGDQLYFDKSEGVNKFACKGVTVYQAPGKVTIDRLEKATTIGVGKALDVTGDLDPIRVGDLIGGRKSKRNGQTYYEFDMAVAPKTCGSYKENANNLGLGFCPYDTIYLISATLIDEKLYVAVVESNDIQWKFANSDLKRVRSSFKVETA